MISTTPFPADPYAPVRALLVAAADAMNRRIVEDYNRIGSAARPFEIGPLVKPARDVVVRYARRADRFSLEILRWQRLDRTTMRRRLREHLAIDRRQARTLARRLGRLRQRFGEPEAFR